MSIFSENLKHSRVLAGLSRQDMADALGVSSLSYGKYEQGSREPSIEKLQVISRVLHLSIDDLVGVAVDALPEYERHKRYLESIGMKVIECDGGQVDVIPADSKGAHAAPLFGDKDGLCIFMQEVKRNASKETKDVLKQKTNDALRQREREFAFMSGLMEIANTFPDERLKQKDGKLLLISKLLAFVAKYQGLYVPPMQDGRDE
ncbi:helix-turn-helix domain-containing protein [uncultured Selenomonas sp.]|uniref:helix-turn-helix domain-containing protein n=1 Tax=uncultured Selenomonas sp. TaxID=159275 RepID=UPI0025E54170|nr:helix-turn-helix transcriptional regulator [uncultured Selenomonas sp.]